MRDFPAEEAAVRSSDIVEGLAEWLAGGRRFSRIALYAALPGEPNLAGLCDYRPGREFLYPRVREDQSLSFHAVRDPATLVAGHLGIPEPDPEAHPEVPIETIDLFLCPGLGFSRNGVRLGRGAGFYDRALAAARPDVPRIGICFRFQVVSSLPRDPHDQIMTHLADENGLLAVRPTPEAQA